MTSAHKKSLEALQRSREQRHQEALQHADEAIQRLIRDQRPVNFHTVAEMGQVSLAWLYREQSVRQRIEHLRAQNVPPLSLPSKERASDASKEAMLAALRQRVKNLEAENRELKLQIEVLYGQLMMKR